MPQNDEDITLDTYGIGGQCRHHSGLVEKLNNLTHWQRSQNGHLANIDQKLDKAASKEDFHELRSYMAKLLYTVIGVGVTVIAGLVIAIVTHGGF